VGPLSVLVTGGGEAALTEVVFRGAPDAPEAGTSGAFAAEGASLRFERCYAERGSARPLLIGDPGTTLTLTDVVLRDVFGAGAEQSFGRGVDVESGGRATLRRVLLEGATESGLLVSGPGAVASVEDLTVRDTRSDATGLFGRGVMVQLGARLEGARVEVREAREIGVMASEPGTTVALTDLTIVDTLPRACEAGACAGFSAGIGLGAYTGAAIGVERLRIRGSALAGIQLASGGQLDLCEGEVAEQPIAVNLQSPGYDLARLSCRMRWRDNGVNLDATELPVPEPRR